MMRKRKIFVDEKLPMSGLVSVFLSQRSKATFASALISSVGFTVVIAAAAANAVVVIVFLFQLF